MNDTHSVAAGLDYVGRLADPRAPPGDRARALRGGDRRARSSTRSSLTMRKEGHHPGARVVARVRAGLQGGARARRPDDVILINQSGRGDKDIFTIADAFDDPSWREFIIEKAEAYRARG